MFNCHCNKPESACIIVTRFMKSKFDYIIRSSLLLTDFLFINLTIFLTFNIFDVRGIINTETNTNLYFIVNFFWLATAMIFKLYDHKSTDRFSHIKNATINSLICFSVLFIFYIIEIRHNGIDVSLVVYFLAQITITISISRIILKEIVQAQNGNFRHRKKIAIIGFNNTAKQLAKYFTDHKNSYEFDGFFVDNYIPPIPNQAAPVQINGSSAKQKIKGSIRDIIDYAVDNEVKEIYSTVLPQDSNDIQRLMTVADQHSLKVRFVPDFAGMINDSYQINYMHNKFPVITLRGEPLEETGNQVFKRIFDIVFSLMALICIFSWLYPIIAILIKYTSPGPVLFSQLRSGQDNKPFWCLKFRTMYVNDDSDAVQATQNDNRITKLGAFLRKTSLDELPQFFNVLRGDMSVVGPRPHMLKHTEEYSALINKFMVRHYVKPGITGWAQIKGYRGGTETTDLMEKRVEHDIWYMENWSLILDVKIILHTVLNVVKGEEHAY